METISIRDVRGEKLRKSARLGKPMMITDHRVLTGVFIPVSAAWVEYLIERNWSHVLQSIAEGEHAATSASRLLSLDEVAGEDQHRRAAGGTLLAAMAGGVISQAPQAKEIVEQLRTALNPSTNSDDAPEQAMITVRIGQIRAELIRKAGQAGQTIAVRHDRELIGIIIPVTEDLVQFLIEQNVSRILYNIGLAERRIGIDEVPPASDHRNCPDRSAIRPATRAASACE